jgi:hypothetical protein
MGTRRLGLPASSRHPWAGGKPAVPVRRCKETLLILH